MQQIIFKCRLHIHKFILLIIKHSNTHKTKFDVHVKQM